MTNFQRLVPSQISSVTRPFLHTHKQRMTKELAATMAFSHAQFHRNPVNYYHDLRRLKIILLCKKCAGKPAYGHTQIWPNNCCQWRKGRLHIIYRVYFLSNCKDIDYPERNFSSRACLQHSIRKHSSPSYLLYSVRGSGWRRCGSGWRRVPLYNQWFLSVTLPCETDRDRILSLRTVRRTK